MVRETRLGWWNAAVAGLVATVPMTGTMLLLQRWLPGERRRPLPPDQITRRVTERVPGLRTLPARQRRALTGPSHFGYGAMAASLYPRLAPRLPGPPVVRGALFGAAVWAASYLGWLPSAGLHRHAMDEPPTRNALMIAAHLVWGATVGALAEPALERRA